MQCQVTVIHILKMVPHHSNSTLPARISYHGLLNKMVEVGITTKASWVYKLCLNKDLV